MLSKSITFLLEKPVLKVSMCLTCWFRHISWEKQSLKKRWIKNRCYILDVVLEAAYHKYFQKYPLQKPQKAPTKRFGERQNLKDHRPLVWRFQNCYFFTADPPLENPESFTTNFSKNTYEEVLLVLHCFEQLHLDVHYVIFKFQKLLIYRTLKAVGKLLSIKHLSSDWKSIYITQMVVYCSWMWINTELVLKCFWYSLRLDFAHRNKVI